MTLHDGQLLRFIAETCPTVQICLSLCIQSPVDGYLGCFQFGAVRNKVAVSICVRVFAWTQAFFPLG